MTILGLDVSHWQPPPLPWPAFRAAGRTFCIVKATDGTATDPAYTAHRDGARAAGMNVGYYHMLEPGDGAAQARKFAAATAGQPETLLYGRPRYWVDVERPGVTADVLTAFIAEWNSLRPLAKLGIYTGLGAWADTIGPGHAQFAALPLWCGSLQRPAIWSATAIQQNPVPGHLPGYAGPLDLDEIKDAPMAQPTPGAGHGFHGEQTNQIIPLIRRGIQLGIKYKLLNSVHNPGRCKDAHDLLPDMDTISRFKFPHTPVGERWENGQDVEQWDEAEHLACARAQIQLCFDNTNPTERAGIKFYTPGINEWNLTGDLANWTCVGHHLHLMMDEAERRTGEFGQIIRLAVPGLSQGKPQYWQMKQVIATGCFDRMRARGDLFTVHEGRYRWETGDPIPGLGVVIPQAPHCPPYGGSGTGRINYWYDLGIQCDFAVTECYDGLSSAADPADRLFRMKQTDDLYRHNPHYRGTAWFEFVDNDDSDWRDTDFTPTVQSNIFEQEMVAQANVPNPTPGETEMQALFHATTLKDLLLRDASGAVTSDPLALSPDGHVVTKGTMVHVFKTGISFTYNGQFYQDRVAVTADGKSIWGRTGIEIQRV